MSTVTITTEEMPLVLRFGSILPPMTDDEFDAFCRENEDLKVEVTSKGDLVIMPPTGGETGHQNATITRLFGNWVEADGTGVDFDSSTIFILPNGAKRSPDASWVKRERWEALSDEQRRRFPPLCPDFVLELRSRTDDVEMLKTKMEEYIENGAQLGWLIDPRERKVYVYQPHTPINILDQPNTVSGDPLLSGFVLPVSKFWK